MRRFALFLSIAAFTATAPALAQEQSLSRAQQSQSLEARFKKFDADGDGRFGKADYVRVNTAAEQEAKAELKKDLTSEFGELDANKDQNVTAAEVDAKIQGAPGAQAVARLDRNKDGKISLAEYTAQVANLRPTATADQQIKRWDKSGDGIVTRDEFVNGGLALFDSLDANKDGVVTAAEASPKPAGNAPQGR